MKANELMIGDWVLAEIYEERREPRQIEDIYGELFNATIWYGYEIQGGYKITDANPIPLTAEILEKNGFEYDDLPAYRHIDEDGRVFTIYVLQNRGTLYIDCGGYLPTIHHVHELQHALRLCGLTELADNFKVE